VIPVKVAEALKSASLSWEKLQLINRISLLLNAGKALESASKLQWLKTTFWAS